VLRTLQKLPGVDARFIGTFQNSLVCFRIGRFPEIFALQLHAKVRGYDASCSS
jgi:hypothetical protein